MKENYKIYNDNFLNVINKIEDESVDLVVVDPPYKIVKGGCTNNAVTYSGSTKEDLKTGRIFNNNQI